MSDAAGVMVLVFLFASLGSWAFYGAWWLPLIAFILMLAWIASAFHAEK